MGKSFQRPIVLLLVVIAAAVALARGARGQSLEVNEGGTKVSLNAGSNPIIGFVHSGVTGLLDVYFAGNRTWTFLPIDILQLQPNFSRVEITTAIEGELVVASENQIQRYVTDADADNAAGIHIWHQDTTGATDRMMQLENTDGGDLLIGGQLSINQFDLAETFWKAGPVEPGELVAVAADRSDAVRRTVGAYEPTLLGVASASPGVRLGGRGFSVDDLRRVWGDAIAADYEARRPALEAQALDEQPELRAASERLRSVEGFAAHLARLGDEDRTLDGPGARRRAPRPDQPPSAEQLAVAYGKARETHEMLLFDATAQLFLDQSFAAVALAGRVPVKADASFGAIRPGDALTSSPTPGVAMKAVRSGPIVGTALGSLNEGVGTVEVFVHRGWFGGEGASLGARVAAPSRPDARDLEIAELKSRLAALEGRLEGLLSGQSMLARSEASPVERAPSP